MAAVAAGVRPLPAHGLPALRPVQPGPSPGPAAPRPRRPWSPVSRRSAHATDRVGGGRLPSRTRPPSASARPPRTSDRGSSSLIWMADRARMRLAGRPRRSRADAPRARVRRLPPPWPLTWTCPERTRVAGQEQHLSAGAGAYPAQRQGAETGHRDVVEDGRLLGPTACDTRRSHDARPGTRESRVIVDGGATEISVRAPQTSQAGGAAKRHRAPTNTLRLTRSAHALEDCPELRHVCFR